MLAAFSNRISGRISFSFFLFVFICFLACIPNLSGQAFITRWNTSYPGPGTSSIVVPGTGSYHIDWFEVANPANNGSLNATNTVTVGFPSPGIYEVSITGGLTAITFNNDVSRSALQILSIEQWGNIAWTTMENAFYGCLFLEMNATDAPNLSNVTSMRYMLYGNMAMNGTISHWDVSNITDMGDAFAGISFFNNQSLNSWNVSNVTNMEAMFYYTPSFNSDVSAWDVSNVTEMRYLFFHTSFNIDIGMWDVANVTNMELMFGENTVFNQDISGWDVSNVTDMSEMFQGATSFNQPIGSWNTSSVQDIMWMFADATSFNQDLSSWDVSDVTFFYRVFSNAVSFNQSLATWDVSNATTLGFMLNNCGMSISNYDATLIAWNSQAVQNGVPLGAQGLKYCVALPQRNNLISSKGWVITGDALDCSLGLSDHETEAGTPVSSENNLKCYPNPWNVSQYEVLSVSGVEAEELMIDLLHVAGNVVYSEKYNAVQGEISIENNNLKSLPEGLYVLQLRTHKEIKTIRIVLTHK